MPLIFIQLAYRVFQPSAKIQARLGELCNSLLEYEIGYNRTLSEVVMVGQKSAAMTNSTVQPADN